MKHLRRIRIALSVVVIMVTTALIWLGSTAPRHYLLTIDVMSLALGAVSVWLAATLLLGRVYCSSACPLGTLQDAVAWLHKRASHRGRGYYRFEYGNWRLRAITLLLLVVSVTSDTSGYQRIGLLCDPTTLYNNATTLAAATARQAPWWQPLLGGMALGTALVLAAVCWMAWRGGRSFCNTICPVGTVLGGVSQFSLMQFDIDPDLCVACGACERECKASCVSTVQHTIDHSRCVMCLNCAASCPNHAIKYRVGRHRLTTPLLRRSTSLSATMSRQQ